MAPPRRAARRRSAAAAAESPRASRRLSVRRGEPFKREARDGSTAAAEGGAGADDDGLPLSDEALLLVFSALSAASADLVRCAATCRRWRRLVSADAAFICRGAPPPRADPFVRTLALGLFLTRRTDLGAAPAPPRFVPLSATAAERRQPAIAELVGGASRVLASRGGRLVLDLRRRANSRSTHVVRLGVCDPMAAAAGGGGVDVLPALRGKESPTGPFASTVITAADEHGAVTAAQPQGASSYRVLLLYNRRNFTALRCYSSDAGSWGPEAQVVGARIGRRQLRGEVRAAVVHHGVVHWPRLAVALRLNSLLQPAPAVPPPAAKKSSAGKTPPPLYTVAGVSLTAWQRRHWSMATMTSMNRLLGVMPDGELLRVEADNETIRAYWGGLKGGDGGGGHGGGIDGGCLLGEALKWKWTMKQALMGVRTVRLRWLFEKSGLFIFTARDNTSDDLEIHVYTMDVETKRFGRVATGGGEPLLMDMCGYEMDRVALLASLGR